MSPNDEESSNTNASEEMTMSFGKRQIQIHKPKWMEDFICNP